MKVFLLDNKQQTVNTWDLTNKVQAYILEHYRGEQPVGSSFIIDSGVKGIKLIHTPDYAYSIDH